MSIRHSIKQNKLPITFTLPEHMYNRKYYNEFVRVMRENGEHAGSAFAHGRYIDLSPKIRNKTCFAFVRNPWSRVVSRYTFLIITQEQGNKRKGYKKKSFEEFLEERHVWGGKKFYHHRAIRNWYNQVEHVVDENNEIKVDCLRTEFLEEDFERYFGFPINMRRRNVSNTKQLDYKDFYNKKTKQIIDDWYAEDIETFGFTFEGPATKQII